MTGLAFVLASYEQSRRAMQGGNTHRACRVLHTYRRFRRDFSLQQEAESGYKIKLLAL